MYFFTNTFINKSYKEKKANNLNIINIFNLPIFIK